MADLVKRVKGVLLFAAKINPNLLLAASLTVALIWVIVDHLWGDYASAQVVYLGDYAVVIMVFAALQRWWWRD